MPHKDEQKGKKYIRDWRRRNPQRLRQWEKAYATGWRRKLAIDVKLGLGGRCVCCGEAEMELLTVDHVKDDASRRVRGHKNWYTYYAEIKRAFDSGDPARIAAVKAKYQLLCHNCNSSKHYGKGVCVHQRLLDPTTHPLFPYANLVPMGSC